MMQSNTYKPIILISLLFAIQWLDRRKASGKSPQEIADRFLLNAAVGHLNGQQDNRQNN